MIKFLFFFLVISKVFANTVQVTWTGVSGVLIEDAQTAIGIDLTFTKPAISHWLFNKSFTSDESLILEKIQTIPIRKLHGLFASHSHFDHAVDLPFLAHHFNAPVYASESLANLTKSYNQIKSKNAQIISLVEKTKITIGAFTVTAFSRIHAPILQSFQWHFLPGKITSLVNLNFYDYREGETWSYLIEHENGNLYFDQSGIPNKEILKTLPPIKTAIIGVANKKSVEDWIDGYGKTLKPQTIIPTHYDWFLLKFPEKPFTMWRSQLPELGLEVHNLGSLCQH